ncbi:MAG TPA: GerMN domain-containing protein [Acidimicrobiia bacterium]|nr:GerMN domain-containing protein [Acidimicrobiia bacterium]
MRRIGLAFAAVALAACGIPIDAAPVTIDIEAAVSPDDGGPVLGELAAVSLYLIRDEALVPVTRDLPSPPVPDIVLGSLLEGVTEPEQRANLRTAIPPGTRSNEIAADGPVLRVDLSREFASVGGEEEIFAVAQIVLTATSIEGIDLVAFELDGVPTDVPVASGALSDDPVGAGDYQPLLAP